MHKKVIQLFVSFVFVKLYRKPQRKCLPLIRALLHASLLVTFKLNSASALEDTKWIKGDVMVRFCF